ncbi:hypothetical protein A2862_02870 [Candidatus Roizmanbacteria bacterium RIFCSPHIGHO2_01_FULL_38_41]|nr:MAG: hypothetical protein A2862_02870 [Candidatus Roizmanbacteria bacterium RIFCSPHIGHO2_01_FULL_38_41]
MDKQEKKYKVDSFDEIKRKLKVFHAPKVKEAVSVHYYGQRNDNNVEKFVEHADRIEIHILEESAGKFILKENKEIASKDEGFSWLKKQGYSTAQIVKMEHEDYSYQDGMVGLYTIDDFHYSVILYYPPDRHAAMEKEFGLENAEVITIPYNKMLAEMGKLRLLKLE